MVYLFVGNITDFYDGCLIILKILISLTTIKRKKRALPYNNGWMMNKPANFCLLKKSGLGRQRQEDLCKFKVSLVYSMRL